MRQTEALASVIFFLKEKERHQQQINAQIVKYKKMFDPTWHYVRF